MKVWIVEYRHADRDLGMFIIGIACTPQGALDLLRRKYPTASDMNTLFDDPPVIVYNDKEDDDQWYIITEWEVE